MKKSSNWILVIILGTTATIWVLGYSIVAAERKMELDDAPQAVQTTIKDKARGASIIKVEKEIKGGQTVYEAEILQDGKKVEFLVSASGRLLDDTDDNDDRDDDDDDEQSVAWTDLPDSVKNTLNQSHPGVQFQALSREVEDGYELFEAAYKDGDTVHELKLTANGYILESEMETPYQMIPSDVRSAIESKFSGARVEVGETVQMTFYEVLLITADGKEHEVKLLANGQFLDDDHDDDDDDDHDDDDDDDHDDDDH